MTSPIDPRAPIRLADIIPIAFPFGGMTISGLRKEAERGHLTIMRMAGKDFTTLADIEEMKNKCRVSENRRDSGSDQVARSDPLSGLSLTEESKLALDSAWLTVRRLKGNSPDTLPKNLQKSQKASTEKHPRS